MKKKNREISDEVKELLNGSVDIAEIKSESKEEKEEHFEIVNKIAQLRQSFDDLDNYFNSLSELQSENDEIIQDLLHYAEDHKFTPASALKFVNLLKEKRLRRRRLNYDYEIKKTFDNGRNRFAMANQREMSMADIYKAEKRLLYSYNYRRMTEEDINVAIEVKRGRHKKDDEDEILKCEV